MNLNEVRGALKPTNVALQRRLGVVIPTAYGGWEAAFRSYLCRVLYLEGLFPDHFTITHVGFQPATDRPLGLCERVRVLFQGSNQSGTIFEDVVAKLRGATVMKEGMFWEATVEFGQIFPSKEDLMLFRAFFIAERLGGFPEVLENETGERYFTVSSADVEDYAPALGIPESKVVEFSGKYSYESAEDLVPWVGIPLPVLVEAVASISEYKQGEKVETAVEQWKSLAKKIPTTRGVTFSSRSTVGFV